MALVGEQNLNNIVNKITYPVDISITARVNAVSRVVLIDGVVTGAGQLECRSRVEEDGSKSGEGKRQHFELEDWYEIGGLLVVMRD